MCAPTVMSIWRTEKKGTQLRALGTFEALPVLHAGRLYAGRSGAGNRSHRAIPLPSKRTQLGILPLAQKRISRGFGHVFQYPLKFYGNFTATGD